MNKITKKPQESELDEELEDLDSEDIIPGETDKHARRRKRIKIRRRIRIKKRTSPKKKAKKTMETAAWVLIVAAFIITLVILLLQLDLTDKRTKNWIGKPVASMIPDFRFTVYDFVESDFVTFNSQLVDLNQITSHHNKQNNNLLNS